MDFSYADDDKSIFEVSHNVFDNHANETLTMYTCFRMMGTEISIIGCAFCNSLTMALKPLGRKTSIFLTITKKLR